MKKLAAWAGGVSATWAGYHTFSNSVDAKTDAILLGIIAAVSLECVLVQILWTWKWRALSLGLLSFFLGTALLYTRVSISTFGHHLWQTQAVIELIRSLYLVGAVLVAIGLTRWAWFNRDAIFPWKRNGQGREPFMPPDRVGEA